MSPPTISAVVPTYNRRVALLRAIESLDRQTLPVNEIVVVDDGSTDDTVVAVSSLPRSGRAPLKIRRQSNAGPAAARNAGVAAATAMYIAFLDDDDRWLPDKLRRQIEILHAEPDLALLGCATNTLAYPGGCRVVPISLRHLLLRNWFLTPGVIVRRDVLLACGGFPEDMRHCEDYGLWLRIASGHRCALLNDRLVVCGEGKAPFGSSGLSSDLDALYAGELEALHQWQKYQSANPLIHALAVGLAGIRHCRRRTIVACVKQ